MLDDDLHIWCHSPCSSACLCLRLAYPQSSNLFSIGHLTRKPGNLLYLAHNIYSNLGSFFFLQFGERVHWETFHWEDFPLMLSFKSIADEAILKLPSIFGLNHILSQSICVLNSGISLYFKLIVQDVLCTH